MEVNPFDNNYRDFRDRPATLTKEELCYFHDTVALIRVVLGVSIPIYNRDHERDMDGKHKNALGIFYTDDPKDPAADCFITIDNFFIHECYEEKFKGAWNLSFESLEGAICHEIAHMTQFRHCKRHKALTGELLRRVEDYQAQRNKPSLDAQINTAASRAAASSQSHKNIHRAERM